MKRPEMPIGNLNRVEWQAKNYKSLLYWYNVTPQELNDFLLFCDFQFASILAEEMNIGMKAATEYANAFYERRARLIADVIRFPLERTREAGAL